MKSFVGVLVAIFLLAGGVALADKGWTTVGSIKGAGSKTFAVNQEISRVAVTCTEGEIEFVSLDVNAGGKKTPYKPNASLSAGQTQPVSVGNQISCQEITVQIGGQGACDVKVRP